eukprot:2840988-Amphidinium_carterae.1
MFEKLNPSTFFTFLTFTVQSLVAWVSLRSAPGPGLLKPCQGLAVCCSNVFHSVRFRLYSWCTTSRRFFLPGDLWFLQTSFVDFFFAVEVAPCPSTRINELRDIPQESQKCALTPFVDFLSHKYIAELSVPKRIDLANS